MRRITHSFTFEIISDQEISEIFAIMLGKKCYKAKFGSNEVSSFIKMLYLDFKACMNTEFYQNVTS